MAENEYNFCPKLTPDKRCKLISDMSRPQNAGTLPVPSVCTSPTRCTLYVASMEAEVARLENNLDTALSVMDRQTGLISNLRARVAELTGERDSLMDQCHGLQRDADERDDLKLRISELEAALKPFAKAADRVDELARKILVSENGEYHVRVGDLRKARAALTRKSHRWIPVSEDDPEEDMLVFVANMDASFKSITIGMFNGQRWRTWNGFGIYVTHWMSLPFPDWPEEGAAAPKNVAEMYHELVEAVGNKHPGESRHETALRYIRSAERTCEGLAAPEATRGKKMDDSVQMAAAITEIQE